SVPVYVWRTNDLSNQRPVQRAVAAIVVSQIKRQAMRLALAQVGAKVRDKLSKAPTARAIADLIDLGIDQIAAVLEPIGLPGSRNPRRRRARHAWPIGRRPPCCWIALDGAAGKMHDAAAVADRLHFKACFRSRAARLTELKRNRLEPSEAH